MPAWLLSFIISMALKLGIAWLMRRFPNLQQRFPILWAILSELIKKVESGEMSRQEAEIEAHKRIKKECFGVACSTPTVGEP